MIIITVIVSSDLIVYSDWVSLKVSVKCCDCILNCQRLGLKCQRLIAKLWIDYCTNTRLSIQDKRWENKKERREDCYLILGDAPSQ